MSNLVIVESPSKAKTIQKYLGKDYKVTASVGHIRDLPAAKLSVDVKNDFAPKYAIVKGKEKLVKELKEMVKTSEIYSDYMNLNSNIKRMDSLMVASRCKRMSRLEIIYSTTANAVRLIHRLGNEELIPKELLHYLDSDDYNNVIYYCKGDDFAAVRLQKARDDAKCRGFSTAGGPEQCNKLTVSDIKV